VNLVVEAVYDIVSCADGTSQGRIPIHKGIQDILDHGLHDFSHPGNIDIGFDLGLLIQRDSTFTDVDRLVPIRSNL